jgi:translin
VHRQEPDKVEAFVAEAHDALREAQEALAPHPAVKYAGFLHDAEKEYAEAVLTGQLVAVRPLSDAAAVGVQPVAWLHGLCEAASELRRHMLDRLRAGGLDEAEALLRAMEDVYDLLVTVDFPDALTAGLRRATDSLRAVLERSRADLTTTMIQARLQQTLRERTGDG